MEQENRASRYVDGIPHQARESWNIGAVGDALGMAPTEAADIVHGVGQRFTVGEPESVGQATLELYVEHGVVRFTNVAEGVQVTLFGQETPPRMTAEGIVFEQLGPTRHFAVRKDGSTTLIVDASPDRKAEASPTRAVDALEAANQQSKETGKRGRIEGNLAYDPVFKVTSQKQREITTFVVAEHYTDDQGEQQTIFHRCAAFNTERKRLADLVRDQVRQGDTIIAHGSWHEVPITYRNGTQKVERQLWVYGVKITSKGG